MDSLIQDLFTALIFYPYLVQTKMTQTLWNTTVPKKYLIPSYTHVTWAVYQE